MGEEMKIKRKNIWAGMNFEKGRVLDELTKRIKVKVCDFNGKFDYDAFHDCMVPLNHYFEW
jgi:hypothetical protein